MQSVIRNIIPKEENKYMQGCMIRYIALEISNDFGQDIVSLWNAKKLVRRDIKQRTYRSIESILFGFQEQELSTSEIK